MKNEGGQRSWMCLREKSFRRKKKVFVNKQKLPLPLSHFTRDANFSPRRTSVPQFREGEGAPLEMTGNSAGVKLCRH